MRAMPVSTRRSPQLKAASQTAPVVTAESAAAEQQAASGEQQAEESDSGWSLSSLNPFRGGGSDAPTKQQMAYQPMGQEVLPITIGVADYTTGPHGYTVTLDNGQVWQNYPRLVDAPPFSASHKNVVVITRGLLGGYSLYLKGRGGQTYKVVRVK